MVLNVWNGVVFSDECSEKVYAPQQSHLAFGLQNSNNIRKCGSMRLVVWTEIWKGGRVSLYRVDGDPNSRKKGDTTHSYIKLLEEAFYEITGGLKFNQNNAPIYKAGIPKLA